MSEYIWGKNPVLESLRSTRPIEEVCLATSLRQSPSLQEVIQLAKARGIEVHYVASSHLNQCTHGAVHQGYLAKAVNRTSVSLEDILLYAAKKQELPLLLILDSIQDIQNLGSLLRTAEAVGVHGVILPKHNAATITPDVIKTSAGATEHLYITYQINLTRTIEWLQQHDVWVAGLSEHTTEVYTQTNLTGAIAIVVGNEGKGLSRLVSEHCDILLRIPMQGKIQSLNAAVAGSILLYETVRQRSISI
jgi:23S rRNA (guanosine2251-2'-O)-methyltransferase